MSNEYEFTDRYQALGIPYPDVETMCKGQCDGVGVYPQRRDDPTITPVEREMWQRAHEALNAHEHGDADCDGWHFIKCSDCNGTGKRQ
jgi:hypothetical protein